MNNGRKLSLFNDLQKDVPSLKDPLLSLEDATLYVVSKYPYEPLIIEEDSILFELRNRSFARFIMHKYHDNTAIYRTPTVDCIYAISIEDLAEKIAIYGLNHVCKTLYCIPCPIDLVYSFETYERFAPVNIQNESIVNKEKVEECDKIIHKNIIESFNSAYDKIKTEVRESPIEAPKPVDQLRLLIKEVLRKDNEDDDIGYQEKYSRLKSSGDSRVQHLLLSAQSSINAQLVLIYILKHESLSMAHVFDSLGQIESHYGRFENIPKDDFIELMGNFGVKL